MSTRRVLRAAAVLCGLVAAWLALTGPASAHAVLESAVPADGQQLDASPREIRLEFSEPVTLPPDALRVHDANGAVVPLRPPAVGDTSDVVRAPVDDPLPEGSYLVTWRVVSADGHPIAGGLVFSVGDPGQVDATVVRQVFASGSARPAAVAGVVVRWTGYLGVLVAAGGLVFLMWAADPRDRWALRGGVRLAAAVGAGAAVLAVPVQAAESSGAGLEALGRLDLLAAALTGGVGAQSTVQVLALGAVLVVLGGRSERTLMWVLPVAAVAVAALVMAGHTRTTRPAWLIVGGDVLHALAAATWVGGLALLWPAVRRRHAADDPVGAAGTVARFSTLATGAVLVVAAAGTLLSWMLVRTTGALTSTAYGRVLLAKLLLAVAVIAVGAYNNRRLVPAVVAGAAPGSPEPSGVAGGMAVPAGSAAGGERVTVVEPATETSGHADAAAAWRRLRRTVRVEVAVLTLVVAVTAALVGMRPAAEAAGVTEPFSAAVPLGADAQVSVTVDPNRAGHNTVHLYVLDATGRPVDATEVQLRMSLPANDVGPLVRTPTFIAPGHWVHSGNDLVTPGRWSIETLVTVSRFEQRRAAVAVDVLP